MEERITIDDKAVEARLREKADDRMQDLDRLGRGDVTPGELQAKNSLFPSGWMETCVIENLYENVGR